MDHNATTPVDPNTMGAFDRMCRRMWANPSSLHTAGINAWEEIESCRNNIGEYFRCDPQGIHFCSSGSEAMHAGMAGIMARYPDRALITTAIEHPAVKHPARIFGLSGRKVVLLSVDRDGVLDIEQLRKAVSGSRKSFLVLSPVNHETGGIQPVEEIAGAALTGDCIIFFDAVQAAARMQSGKWAPFCDMFSISGHKLYAPKGTALLWKREGILVRSFRLGGYQERGLFPGTINAPGIAALSSAVDILRKSHREELRRLRALGKEGLSILRKSGIEYVLESPANSAPGVLCISFPWVKDMEDLLYFLAEHHICVSRFSACSSRVSGPSQILLSMGRSRRRASASIRISLGRWSKRDDFYRLASVIGQYRDRALV